jgi:type I restriction enzyme S subunit
MEKIKNIPSLRFPEFEGEWKIKKLGEVAERVTTKNKEHNKNVLTISAQHGLISQMEYFTKSVSAKNVSGYYLLSKDDFAYNKSYSNGYPMGAIKRLNRYEKGVVSTLYICFRFSNKIENSFIEQFFETGNQNIEIEKVAQEGARNHGLLNIGLADFFSINIPFTTLHEQTKIASFLTVVDEKLQALKQKKTLLEQYKKGVMKRLFSQEIRFKDDNGYDYPDWEEKKLGDTLNITIDNRGKTPPTLDHGIPLLEVNSIGNKNIKYNAVSKFVSELTFETWFRKHLKEGDVLFSTVGNTALCSYYDGNIKACIAQNIVGLRFNTEVGLFMYYLLIEDKNNNKFKQIEMGAVQPSVKVSQMIDLFFEIPSTPEQTKIANFLSAIDDKIKHCQSQIDKTEAWKKGLLQQMFV